MPELEQEGNLNVNESLARVLRFVTLRRWWILVPFCVIILGTAAVLWKLPNRYTSKATLLVVQQQVSERYVTPNSTTDIASALGAMKQQVLSRTQLLRMVNDFDLYPKQRGRIAPEQLMALIMRDIDILPIKADAQQRNFDAFQISFTTESPILAQKVTTTLTSLFINEYLRTGAEHASSTTSFLHEQVLEKEKELRTQEERLRDFKLQYSGELPEQQQGNLGILTGLQGQLQNTMANLNRAQQQRAFLQAQIEATSKRSFASDIGVRALMAANPSSVQLSPLEAAQRELNRLETERAALLGKGYGPQHPEIIGNQRQIAEAEDSLKRLKALASSSRKEQPSTQDPAALADTDDAATIQLKSSLEANRLEIENLTNEQMRLKTSIAQYENRINLTPVREQQQAGMLRNTELLRQEYSDLLKKEQDSQLATNLEKQQGGQQFRLIDPASLPTVPSSPKRLKISLGAAAVGLLWGLGLGILMEMRDTSYYAESDVTKHLSAPFVISIPQLSTAAEERQQKWRSMFQWLAAAAMLLVVFAADFYVVRNRF